jgi:hypothetical protein
MRQMAWGCVLALAVAGPMPVGAEPIVGLTPFNQIFSFDSGSPGTIGPLIPVTGLVPDTFLVGIDFRPATPGTLVGVGVVFGLPPLSGNVYTIDTTTGVAVMINTIPAVLATGPYGVDFNPVVNALRIVNLAGQNLRIVAGGTGAVNVDTNLNPGTFPGNFDVLGAAYSNNVAGATVTTLYDISLASPGTPRVGQLLTQGSPNGSPISPNTGTLFPVGPLGVNPFPFLDIGFDISASTGVAFASLVTEFNPSLYTINLGTGAATLIGQIDVPDLSVIDIAVSNAGLAAVPAPGSLALLGIGAAALLVRAARSQRKRSGSIA